MLFPHELSTLQTVSFCFQSKKSRDKDKEKEKEKEKEKDKMVTMDKELLFACSFFDLSHIGYFESKDLVKRSVSLIASFLLLTLY